MDGAAPWIAGWILLHVGGLALAWGTRIGSGARAEPFVQLAFMAAMAAIAATAMICHHQGSGITMPSGVTLVVMVVAAVSDIGRRPLPERRTAVDGFR